MWTVGVRRSAAAEEIAASGGARVVAAGDDGALAEAAAALAGDAAEARATGERGGAWVRATCSPAAVAEAYERVYDAALAGR